ncbi:hypothetical protein GALMADRAFT_220742 [Galerina marginata CBS 339.88]|uniref:sterol 3beta-glucosyltransferase n=1 Tax=Galerina marginata (strain CBS 339.88) TaxID=685588 RepID=A0A067TK88_GALM3|nr:hypothetical protein GALMADRAFT_220742 [Galerina marginata CBS 339.88]
MSPKLSRIFSLRKPATNPGESDVATPDPVVAGPIHASTTLSRSSEDSVESPFKTKFPLVSKLFTDAGKFEKVLLQSGCVSSAGICPKGSTGFADLVAHDLNATERACVDRDARVSATNKSWMPLELDHNALSDDEELASTVPPTSATSSQNSEDFDISIPTIRRAATFNSECLDHLEPKDIVDILVREFGPLVAPGEEEKLLLEVDGCLLRDVAIVGVIHLTTHRLTFHASLLATRPDLVASQGVIKVGAAVMHRKGWRTKRRVWFELSHDLICTYASSKDEEKTRPLSTLLLSFVKEVIPLDPKKPRIMRLSIEPTLESANDYVEFDTEESAHDWRKEITGALFNYRHLRREVYTSSAPESKGVRLNCPLSQIIKLQPSESLDFSSVVSLTVQSSASDFQFDNEDLLNPHVFEIGPIFSIPIWERLVDLIADAKQRQGKQDILSPVLIDFGPYDIFGADNAPNKPFSHLAPPNEKTIRNVLGFAPDTEIWITTARIYRSIASSGHFVISYDYLGFWGKSITQNDIRYRLPISMVQDAKPFNLGWLNVEGIKLWISGKSSANFVFKSASTRDQAFERINAILTSHKLSNEPSKPVPLQEGLPPGSKYTTSSDGMPTHCATLDPVSIFAPLSRSVAAAVAASGDFPQSARTRLPKVINFPSNTLITRKFLHFICLTIGSRGDVQPYIALGLGLKKEGHSVTIVTHEEYRDWITGFDLGHRTAGGDPGSLMKLSVENKMFSPEFFRKSLTNFRPWLEQLLLESWAACRDADVLLESPSAMAGVHIAEALNIPYFRTFTMPWTKTTAFPHAFFSPPVESPTFNSASNVMWAATSAQINKWRRLSLGLANTDMGHLAQSKITFIYNFSQAVVPKPMDWPDTTIISGYWFLDNPELNWAPPKDLLDWMAKARADSKPIVYIGFGSIIVPRPNKVTAAIVKAVLRSDVRAIISKGWSARMSKPGDKDPPVGIPPECYFMDKVPHDWLFPRIDAALHHGGAGTTGASLRAGIPTLIKPWFGDQYFWASRVQVMGVGLKVPSLRVDDLVEALTKASQSSSMKSKAAAIGKQIRKEDGVHTAIHTIYTYLHRASQDRLSLDKS